MTRRVLASSAAALALSALAVAFAQGIDLGGIDPTVKPGDDFFSYANGAWLKATEIPADRSSWGTNGVLAAKVEKDVADLIQGAAAMKPKPGTEAAKIADYYAAFMDEGAIEKKGASPLTPQLNKITAIKDRKELSAYFGSQLRADVDVMNATQLTTDNLFGLWVAADFDKPTLYSAFLLQGGLSLPNKDYYTSDSPRMAELRGALKVHIAAVLNLAGVGDAKLKAEKIFALEDKIARVHASVTDTEDPEKGDNHWPYADLAKKAPGIDWVEFLKAGGLSNQKTFVIWQPSAFTGEAKLVAETPIDTWKDYLSYHYIDRNSGLLSKGFVEERFSFYGKTLSGTPALAERWKRGIAGVNNALGEAVGKLYVAKYFPASSKAEVAVMVKNIMAAFDKRIDGLDWMDQATKREAKAKLKSLKVGIGYPDTWKSYAALVVKKDDAFGNAQRAALFDSQGKIARLAKPVDRGEWVMNAQLVNAVNLPILNALNFPAAELQPPHFDPRAPAAANYASVGAIIGHEISHSFDNNGALFDAHGRMRNWWTKADFAHFDASGKALAAQFDGYRPFQDVAIKGEQTLSENIADVAGLAASYDAYRAALGGKEGPTLGGFTGDQQFFIAFAQSWRNKTREAALRQQVLTDGHAPAQYRALTVRNLDAWYSAFGVKPGEGLFLSPKDRVKVW